MSTPAVAIHELTKRYRGGPTAVDALSLDVERGELLALVGESGCGKSTLLRVIAGLEIPDSGTVRLAGSVVSEGRRVVPAERRGVGMVFQNHALFPHLDVLSNVGFGLRRMARKQRVARIEAALDLVGLPDLAGRYIHELSGGQRQRVALARAIAPEPSLILLDEPLSSLDERLRVELRDDIARLLRARGASVVWVTHRAEDALAVADRAAVLRHGRTVQRDRPEVLYRRPANAYVARLFGEVNLVSEPLARALGAAGGGSNNGGRWLIRPEDVVSQQTGSGGLRARVVERRFQGATERLVVEVELEDHDPERMALAAPPGTVPSDATHVTVRARHGALHPLRQT